MKNMNILSDNEITEFTQAGKGNVWTCAYAMSACSAGLITGFDCGTCSWVIEYCTGISGGGDGNDCGSICTCH